MRLAVLAAVATLATSGCVIGDATTTTGAGGSSSGGGDAGAGTSGVAEVDALFGTLTKATSDKLTGVWSTTTTAETGDAEVRFRFAKGKLVAGVRCTYPSRGNTVLTAGAATTLTTPDMDAAAGEFRIGDGLKFQKTSGDLDCQGRFDNLSYTFQIQGLVMLLGAAEAGTTASLTKVGD